MYQLFGRLGTPQLVSFATTTTRQRNRASVTRKNTKNVKLSVSNGSSHNEYVYRHNAIANRLFGLKTWSRCRGSVAVCPSLLFGYTQNRYQFIRSSMQETCSGKLRHNKNILNNNYIISFNKCQPLF